jgi:hypothetical protein
MSTFCQKSMLTYCKLKSSFRKELRYLRLLDHHKNICTDTK